MLWIKLYNIDLEKTIPIFKDYENIREDIKLIIERNNVEEINKLAENFCLYLMYFRPKYTTKNLLNIALFLTDIPIINRWKFVEVADKCGHMNEEFKYINEIHLKLMKINFHNALEEFYEEIIRNDSTRTNIQQL